MVCQADARMGADAYLRLRSLAWADLPSHRTVREDSDGQAVFQSKERFLQVLWNEQHFVRDLRTTLGEKLEIASPGTWNVEPGPDFLKACLAVDGRRVSGDVEVHRHVEDWDRHRHGRDRGYDNVVLHVVWDGPIGCERGGPQRCFVLKDHLTEPWRRLLQRVDADIYPYARRVQPGRCAVQWALTETDAVSDLLRAAGLARFEDKVVRLQRAGIRRGFDQAVYEHVFEALGYKANRTAFRRLAAGVTLRDLGSLAGAEAREAALFGAAGLLPDPTTTKLPPESTSRAKRLWDRWWAQGREAVEITWVRSRMRPLNSPERRLAAGAALIEKWGLRPAKSLAALAASCETPRTLLRQLRACLTVTSGWDGLASFTTRLRRPAHLLGPDRMNDVVVNVVLPFLVAKARQSGRGGLEELALGAYAIAPRLQGNRPLSEVAHRLLVPPSRLRDVAHGACEQQGLLAIYRDFCLALSNNCENCPMLGALPVEHRAGAGKVRLLSDSDRLLGPQETAVASP